MAVGDDPPNCKVVGNILGFCCTYARLAKCAYAQARKHPILRPGHKQTFMQTFALTLFKAATNAMLYQSAQLNRKKWQFDRSRGVNTSLRSTKLLTLQNVLMPKLENTPFCGLKISTFHATPAAASTIYPSSRLPQSRASLSRRDSVMEAIWSMITRWRCASVSAEMYQSLNMGSSEPGAPSVR